MMRGGCRCGRGKGLLRGRSLAGRIRLRRRRSTDHRLTAVTAEDGAIGLLGSTMRTEHIIPLS